MANTNGFIKREVTFGQLMTVLATILVAMYGSWMSNHDSVLQMREQIKTFQQKQFDDELRWDKSQDNVNKKLDDISAKLEESTKATYDLKADLNNKQNRR